MLECCMSHMCRREAPAPSLVVPLKDIERIQDLTYGVQGVTVAQWVRSRAQAGINKLTGPGSGLPADAHKASFRS